MERHILEEMTVTQLDDLLDLKDLSKEGLKADKIERLVNFEETLGDKPEVQDYEVRMWANVIPVYVCNRCGLQTDYKEKMIKHVAGHKLVGEGKDE